MDPSDGVEARGGVSVFKVAEAMGTPEICRPGLTTPVAKRLCWANVGQ